ncbi:MAG: alpha/beta hydrolase [Anaerolineales bacterium]|uniref:Alpha/beta hydrolase n=1 Tax=Candidatus Desulfolinea nitratireducens TaxID=2841698 RepID=A0A8J6NIV2_9CHLR|nr:alpha/beta hydrolase [Candidatus Desulfolinea nitratireducens]MBL6961874.1 alpha/beta hydrolase [Anaerolineales bacterium]
MGIISSTPTKNTVVPPQVEFGDITLPSTRLHYVKAGSGPPLVIVPATVSLIRQWLPLVQFMGQRFTTYFFELPGHGGSTPYPEKFESSRVPETVESFVDAMGHGTFNLMGFSFGGLLALRTLERLQSRISKVILLSPSLSQRALKWSISRQWIFRNSVRALKNTYVLKGTHYMMNMPQLEEPLTLALSKFSNVDRRILKSKNAIRLPLSTLDVFAYTVDELLQMDYQYENAPFNTPCYFGMSVNDDILNYEMTEEIVRRNFNNITIQKFTHPYHQPPEPPTFEWLVKEFGRFLDMII